MFEPRCYSWAFLAAVVFSLPTPTWAQSTDETQSSEELGGSVGTGDEPANTVADVGIVDQDSTVALGVGGTSSERFALRAPGTSAFIKPTLWISSSGVFFQPSLDSNPDLADRFSTLILTRFGFQGQLYKDDVYHVRFKSEFERNVGFVSGTQGPVGSGVWEGIAALQARENYIQLEGSFLDRFWTV
ncbi:MAG: hypothetical protein AAF658_21400, partial [Myxococcota bacterium]